MIKMIFLCTCLFFSDAICSSNYNWKGVKKATVGAIVKWSFLSSSDEKPGEGAVEFTERSFPKNQQISGEVPYVGWNVYSDFSKCLNAVLKSNDTKDKRVKWFQYYYCRIDLDPKFQSEFHRVFKEKDPSNYKKIIGYNWRDPVQISRYWETIDEALKESSMIKSMQRELKEKGFSKVRYVYEKPLLLKPQNLFFMLLVIEGER